MLGNKVILSVNGSNLEQFQLQLGVHMGSCWPIQSLE